MSEWQAAALFDDQDKAVFAFTDALTQKNAVPDAIYAELATYFSQPEIVKLTFTVSLAGMVNRVHAAFKTDVDGVTAEAAADTPFCVLPNR